MMICQYVVIEAKNPKFLVIQETSIDNQKTRQLREEYHCSC